MKQLILLTLISLLLVASTIKDPKLPKPFKSQFKLVPSGYALVDSDTLSIQAFYMLDHEVTNGEYAEFVKEIQAKDPSLFDKVNVDFKLWSTSFGEKANFKTFEQTYHNHPAYADYPVVNITQEAAMFYCDWLGEKINAQLPESEKIEVRLPLRAEFIRAGAGSNLNWRYAWGTIYMRNSEGQLLANFLIKPQYTIARDKKGNVVFKDVPREALSNQSTDLTAPSKSYYPNTFEIYNLNGNVAEWLADTENQAAGGSWYDYGYDIRMQSLKDYGQASPMVGFRPVFTYVER